MKLFTILWISPAMWLIVDFTMPSPCVFIESLIKLIDTAFKRVLSFRVSMKVWLNMLYLKFCTKNPIDRTMARTSVLPCSTVLEGM